MMNREIYEGAPLVSVTFELRHPESEPIQGARKAALQRLLAAQFPLMQSQQTFTQTLELGPGGPSAQSTHEEFPRFRDRARVTGVSFMQTSTVIETSQYPGWEEFRNQIEFICEAREAVEPIAGIERLGLRYIDEVRIEQTDEDDWSPWIHSSLLGGNTGTSLNLPLRLWQGALVYGSEPGQGLVLRYGPNHGYAVDPNSDLRRRNDIAPGPFFLLDIDSFWLPENEIPAYTAKTLTSKVEELHRPVRQLFEELITNKYRDEVLRK